MSERADSLTRPAQCSPQLGIVLSGGGARAAYQVGVLCAIGHRMPDCRIPVITGVSAGAINAACLASHTGGMEASAQALAEHWCSLTTRDVFRTDMRSLLWNAVRWAFSLSTGGVRLSPRVRGLVDTKPLRRFLEPVIQSTGIEENLRAGRLRAAAVSATSYQTGQTLTFIQAAPEVRTWERVRRRAIRQQITLDHVMASAAIPLLFPAVRIGNGYYGDGSIRQANPLAPAVHLGANRILAISSRYGRSGREAARANVQGYPAPAQILGLLFNSIFLDSLDADAARLSRINHLISRISKEKREQLHLRKVELLVLRPSRDLGRLAAEYEPRLPGLVRYMIGGLGTRETRSADFVSYLLFERGFIARLIQLGQADAERQWPRIARFLEASMPAAGVSAD